MKLNISGAEADRQVGIVSVQSEMLARTDADLAAPLEWLKQAALLCDEIWVLRLSEILSNSSPHTEFRRAELEWLQEQGLLKNLLIDDRFGDEQELITVYATCKFKNQKLLTRFDELASWYASVALRENNIETVFSVFPDRGAVADQERIDQEIVQMMRQALEKEGFVPTYIQPQPERCSAADTAQIIINAMPEPGPQVDWQQILDFRTDPDTKHKRLALRRWTRKVAGESHPPNVIAEELDWLLHEYEQHMQLHRMKVAKGTLETIVTTTGELLENVAKLKFGSLAKLPFVFKQRQIGMLEAERTAPGREVAYIIKARQTFGNPTCP